MNSLMLGVVNAFRGKRDVCLRWMGCTASKRLVIVPAFVCGQNAFAFDGNFAHRGFSLITLFHKCWLYGFNKLSQRLA